MDNFIKRIMVDDFFDQEVKVSPYKGQIGSIEEKIDQLIGYVKTPSPTLKDVKKEYAIRMDMLDYAKQEAPKEVVQQIEKLENQLKQLRDAREQEKQIDEELAMVEGKQKIEQDKLKDKRVVLMKTEALNRTTEPYRWKILNIVPEAIKRTKNWYTISQARRVYIMLQVEKELVEG